MIKNLGKYAHQPKGNSTQAGRHSAGANPAPGSGVQPPNRAGQPEPAGNKPITGGKTEMRPKAASTSMNSILQAQQHIQRPPAPFKNPAGVANAPAPAVMPNGPTTKHTAGLSGSPAPAHPPKQYNIKTKSHMVGVTDNPPRKVGAMTASAKKGGHSLLYGD